MQELENASQYAELLQRVESNEDNVLQCTNPFKIQNYSNISDSFRSRQQHFLSPLKADLLASLGGAENFAAYAMGCQRVSRFADAGLELRFCVPVPLGKDSLWRTRSAEGWKRFFAIEEGGRFRLARESLWVITGEDQKAFRHDPAVKNETNLKYNGCVTFTWLKQDWNITRSGMSPLWLKEESLA